MELVFLLLLVGLMAWALGSGYPVAFALPGASIIAIAAAGLCGYLFAGNPDAFFYQGGPSQWLSAGVTNLRGVYWEVERDTLIAIPLFIFMGIMLQRSKIAEDLLITMAQLFGPVPGGLGISVVFVGALLAATTGIVGATVVAMGLISLPAMLRNNYSQPLATGTIAASGTLGQIIPPSIVLIILADQLASATDQASTLRKALHKEATGELSMPSAFGVTSTSAGEMFLGALVPGLLLVGLYMLYILVYALIRPAAAPPVRSGKAFDAEFFFQLGLALIPPLALIFLVLGSIISGVATVNQAGAIGAAGALLMAGYRLRQDQRGAFIPALLGLASIVVISYVVAVYSPNVKAINTSTDAFGVGLAVCATITLLISLIWSAWRAYKIDNTLSEVMIETAKATTLVFIILLGAAMLTAAFRAFGGEDLVREFLEGLPGGFWTKFVIVMLVIFILGFFLDFIEIAVVVVPIVAPILLADPSANITAVWLGVMIGLNIQTSFLTPPFGFALFYLRGVAPAIVKTINMYKGVIAFIGLQLTALVIVGLYPPLVNYLPNRVSLLSDTAPPPRNPRIQYCVEEYINNTLISEATTLDNAIANAKALDISALPNDLQKGIADSFAGIEDAKSAMTAAKAAEARIVEASAAYRPIHTFVRDLERDARKLDGEIRPLETQAERLRNDDQAEERAVLQAEIDVLKAERDAILARRPADWETTQSDFAALNKAEATERTRFRRSADGAYNGVKTVRDTLQSSEAFEALADEFTALRAIVETGDPEATQADVQTFSAKFSGIEGASKVRTAVNRVRRALRRNPDIPKALEEFDKAKALYDEQLEWRAASKGALTEGVIAYEQVLAQTIGLRQQDKMGRKPALFVAGCQSGHRNLSLSF
ncbi:MAG: TRAP transporter large permease subunit [Pseudomonadota bacterium]